MVDVYQIFIKGHGIFSNCGSAKHKCKLRALYEAAALGFLIEKAGGKTITAGQGSLLDYVVQGYDDRLYHFFYLVPLRWEASSKSTSSPTFFDSPLSFILVHLYRYHHISFGFYYRSHHIDLTIIILNMEKDSEIDAISKEN